MSVPSPGDWTVGAAKWAAVVVLACASIFGMTWSIFGRAPRSELAGSPVEPVSASTPAPASRRLPGLPRPEAPPQEGEQPPGGLLDLNSATEAQLELLPGIGPALARRIVEYRNTYGRFTRVDQLDDVSGIGPQILGKVRPLVTVK